MSGRYSTQKGQSSIYYSDINLDTILPALRRNSLLLEFSLSLLDLVVERFSNRVENRVCKQNMRHCDQQDDILHRL